MSQKEKVRAVKFPPRSDPLLPKQSSSDKKKENTLPYKGSRRQFWNLSDRMDFSGSSHTETASKVTISKSIGPLKHNGNYMSHLLQYRIIIVFCSHTFVTGWGQVSGSCERGNEPSFWIRYGDFLNWLRNVSFLRNSLLHVLSKVIN